MFKKFRKSGNKKSKIEKDISALISPTIETFIHDKWETTKGITSPNFSSIQEVTPYQAFKVLIFVHQYSVEKGATNISIRCHLENSTGQRISPNNYHYSLKEEVETNKTFLLPSTLPIFHFPNNQEIGTYSIVVELEDYVSNLKKVLKKSIDLSLPEYPTPEVNLESLNNWMQSYYLNPKPLELLHYFQASIKLIPEDNEIASQLNIVFFVEALRYSPFLLDRIIERLNAIQEDSLERSGLLLLLGYTEFDEDNYKSLLSEKDSLVLKELKSEAYINPIHADHLVHPIELDFLWCAFFATGQYKYIAKLVSTLAYRKYNKQKYKNEAEELKAAIYQSALWSLKANAQTHEIVKIYCKFILNSSLDKELHTDLSQIIVT